MAQKPATSELPAASEPLFDVTVRRDPVPLNVAFQAEVIVDWLRLSPTCQVLVAELEGLVTVRLAQYPPPQLLWMESCADTLPDACWHTPPTHELLEQSALTLQA